MLIKSIVETINKQVENYLVMTLANLDPPIKGEITKEKLEARKIKLIRQRKDNTEVIWLEENEKVIYPMQKINLVNGLEND